MADEKIIFSMVGVSKTFTNQKKVLNNIYLSFFYGAKIGIIGLNGSGKSTLMKIIAGIDKNFQGEVVFSPGYTVGYLEQEPKLDDAKTVREVVEEGCAATVALLKEYEEINMKLCEPMDDEQMARLIERQGELYEQIDQVNGWELDSVLERAMDALRCPDPDQSVKVLSGGERRRVALCRLLLQQPDVLLLDEPTNHLDAESIDWLEQHLQQYKGTVIAVTHDRYFLDRVCSDILEVDQRSISLYKGNYAYYVEKKQERAEAAEARRESDLNLYRRELEWMRRQPQARATKARSRIDAFRDLESRLKTTRRSGEVRLDVGASRIGTKIFEARDVSKRFGDVVILDRFNYNFTRYEKLGIVGDNGCGKSTLLKLLTGIERPDSGVIDIGETVRFGYYSQQGLEFDDSMRVIDVVTAIAEQVELGDGRRMSASQLLQHFLFTPETQYNYVARLSGGERRRLYLCTVLMQSPNFLVLDEPTNDLDIVTLGILEEYLQAFRGCVIVVSHDRYFVDKVADHLLVFCGGGEIRDFAGTYSEYVAWKREYEAARRAEAAQARPKPQAAKTQAAEAVPRKLSFNEKRELEALETEIPVLEAEKAALEASLSSGTLPVEELTAQSRRIAELIASIDEKTMRWLELSER